ncbi:MAG: hypothetical protein EZS28_034885 [Streblomastix strix]|uniref:Uncharacterized protein n=1 Tax=Streblomastix strix TaxID=222440 RepID=A0A5J4UGS3_9EUKA|nr:MAG: hypothetical protein EZS28_034885 [Streblomastix strix]
MIDTRSGIRTIGGYFKKMSKNSVKSQSSEPTPFVNFDAPKFTARTPTTTVLEQTEPRDVIGNFICYEYQHTLQDVERQLTPRQAVNETMQAVLEKDQKAVMKMHITKIDFWTMNILVEQNYEACRREVQCPSKLPFTTIQHPDQMLSKGSRENALYMIAKRQQDQCEQFNTGCEHDPLKFEQLSAITLTRSTCN